MNLSGPEFRLDTAREMLPRLIAPWVLDLDLSLEAADIEEPIDVATRSSHANGVFRARLPLWWYTVVKR